MSGRRADLEHIMNRRIRKMTISDDGAGNALRPRSLYLLVFLEGSTALVY